MQCNNKKKIKYIKMTTYFLKSTIYNRIQKTQYKILNLIDEAKIVRVAPFNTPPAS